MVKSMHNHDKALFDIPTDSAPEVRTSFDRLVMVHGELGFTPHSMQELNYATLALDNRDLPGGYARFLNEVLLHQKKSVSKDPTAALRSIVSKVKAFAETTRGDKTMLLQIQEELRESLGVHNFIGINTVRSLEDWENQPATKRGLGLISRQLAVSEALQKQEMINLDSVADNDAIQEMMEHARVFEANDAANGALEQADARFMFWAECLEGAKDHMVVRPMAFQALRSLGVEEVQ